MTELRRVPFLSFLALKEWYLTSQDLEGDDLFKEEIYNGMRHIFKSDKPVFKIFYDSETEDHHVVNIQMEILSRKGVKIQPWIFSLISVEIANEMESRSPELEDLRNPFPEDPIVVGKGEINDQKVLEFMSAWSERFWKDLNPMIQVIRQDDWIISDLKDLFFLSVQESIAPKSYLLTGCEQAFKEIRNHEGVLDYKNTPYGIIIKCPKEIAEYFVRSWPNLFMVEVFI